MNPQLLRCLSCNQVSNVVKTFSLSLRLRITKLGCSESVRLFSLVVIFSIKALGCCDVMEPARPYRQILDWAVNFLPEANASLCPVSVSKKKKV